MVDTIMPDECPRGHNRRRLATRPRIGQFSATWCSRPTEPDTLLPRVHEYLDTYLLSHPVIRLPRCNGIPDPALDAPSQNTTAHHERSTAPAGAGSFRQEHRSNRDLVEVAASPTPQAPLHGQVGRCPSLDASSRVFFVCPGAQAMGPTEQASSQRDGSHDLWHDRPSPGSRDGQVPVNGLRVRGYRGHEQGAISWHRPCRLCTSSDMTAALGGQQTN